MGLMLGLGLQGQQVAGGPSAPVIVAPAEIASQPIIGAAILISDATVSGATSVTHQWFRGNPLSGGTAIPSATAAEYVPVTADFGAVLWRQSTYSNGAGSTVDNTAAPTVTGAQFSEDWSNFAAGDTQTQLLAGGYTRNTTGINAAVVSSAVSPSLKGLDLIPNTSATRHFQRTDIDTFGAAVVPSLYEELFLIEHTGGDAPTFWFKPVAPDNSTILSGFNIRLSVLRHQLGSEDVSAATGTSLGTLTANQLFWVRHRLEGDQTYLRLWDYGEPEPSLWSSSRTRPNALMGRAPRLGTRITGGNERVHFYSAGFNVAAPFWAGFVPPFDGAAESYAYVAPAAGTQVFFGGGAPDGITLTFEDAT